MQSNTIIGREIDGYKIEALLGQGGMGHVYRAFDEKLSRYAAVKILQSSEKNKKTHEPRFYREAKAIAKLKHDNIVTIYRFNEVDNIFYMAMEYIDGADLRWVLRDYAADSELIDHKTLLKNVEQICKALDYSHKNGVIHRDIKPSNIMIARDGTAVLTDFGLALDVDEGTVGETFGSPHYIAPEQAINSAHAVPQTDLYSLGVIIFEMLTGSIPYDSGTVIEIAMSHINDPLPDPLSINPDLHPAFLPVLEKLLAKDPKDRYQSGATIVTALRKAIKEAQQNTSTSSTLNKPEDRIRHRLTPITVNTQTKPHTMLAIPPAQKPVISETQSATRIAPQQGNQASEKPQSQRRLIPLIVLATISLFIIAGYLFIDPSTVQNWLANNTAIVDANDYASIEGQVSNLETNNGYMTLSIYGLDVQITQTNPLYEVVSEADFVIIEGYYTNVDGVLRFEDVVSVALNNTELDLEAESE